MIPKHYHLVVFLVYHSLSTQLDALYLNGPNDHPSVDAARYFKELVSCLSLFSICFWEGLTAEFPNNTANFFIDPNGADGVLVNCL